LCAVRRRPDRRPRRRRPRRSTALARIAVDRSRRLDRPGRAAPRARRVGELQWTCLHYWSDARGLLHRLVRVAERIPLGRAARVCGLCARCNRRAGIVRSSGTPRGLSRSDPRRSRSRRARLCRHCRASGRPVIYHRARAGDHRFSVVFVGRASRPRGGAGAARGVSPAPVLRGGRGNRLDDLRRLWRDFPVPLVWQSSGFLAPQTAGLALVPCALLFFLIAPRSGHMAQLIGVRVMITGGTALIACGLLVLAATDAGRPLVLAQTGLVLAGIGMGLNTGPLMSVAVDAVSAARSGTASALINVARMAGATLGVAF